MLYREAPMVNWRFATYNKFVLIGSTSDIR